jgi:hypothetical protein
MKRKKRSCRPPEERRPARSLELSPAGEAAVELYERAQLNLTEQGEKTIDRLKVRHSKKRWTETVEALEIAEAVARR